MTQRRVAVTGAGACGPHGPDAAALVEAIIAGRSAIRSEGTCCGGRAPRTIEAGGFPAQPWRRLDRCSRLAAVAAAEALRTAGLADGRAGGRAADGLEIGLVAGTMTAGVDSLARFLGGLFAGGPPDASPMLFPFTVPNAPASQCSILLGLRGPSLTVSQMESSGLAAIATAASLVREGVCDVIVAGGAEERVDEFDRAWDRLRLLHRGDPADYPGPFGRDRRGFVPGEGAAFVVLEAWDRAIGRGALVLAELKGEGAAHAATDAHAWPRGPSAPADAMREALSRARMRPEEIGYVAAAANGSIALDAVEARAIREALGPAGRRVPVTGLKGSVGESGVTGACAAVVAAHCCGRGIVPPVAALRDPDPECDLNFVLGPARRAPVPSALINALGTGGSCVAVVLARPSA